ncbi:polyprenyl synthetase family protein [Sphaerisporangium viridialbum]|uniref:polyprenyl synthetase family protein n=1 Tax=Sphaerisporangium viridialbum TaxID=46189 RepID=UPI003C75E978
MGNSDVTVRSDGRAAVRSDPRAGSPDGEIPPAHLFLVENEVKRRWTYGESPQESREEIADPLDEICAYALTAPAKLFRPILLLLSAEAVGGRIPDVLPAAVGTECGHVASLIHDDIIDGDAMRRGRPAVYRKFGMDNAIVAGDALLFQIFVCLSECRARGVPDDRIVTAMEIVARAGVELCRGQALEAEITSRSVRDIDAYLRMIKMKTAALFSGACQCGAVLGGGPPEWVRALGDYGESLGIAFQIQDDLLGYVTGAEMTGKPATSDIKNRRLTLPIIFAYQNGGSGERDVLDAAFLGEMGVDEALDAVGDVLRRTDAITLSTSMARTYAERARAALALLPPTRSRDQLAGFVERTVSRVR